MVIELDTTFIRLDTVSNEHNDYFSVLQFQDVVLFKEKIQNKCGINIAFCTIQQC